MTTQPKAIHEFERCGLGKFPYSFLRVETKKYQACYGAPIQPGSSCDYCGTPIMYEFWLHSSDQKTFKVGCDCVLRTNSDPELKALAKEEQKRIQKANRTEKAISAAKERNARFESENEARKAVFLAENSELIDNLKKYPDNFFFASLVSNFTKWGRLTDNQISAAKDALAKIVAEEFKKPSEFVGTIGQRSVFTLTVKSVISFEGFDFYGKPCMKYKLIMEDEHNNVFVYNNLLQIDCTNKGAVVQIKATIKDHKEYKGVQQTLLSHPKVIEVVKEGNL